jgi:hypothetical protein
LNICLILAIRTPKTIIDVTKAEIPSCVDKMNFKAVIKMPFGNCGDGVYTICNKLELEKFLKTPHYYDKFLVQSLVGDISWQSNQLNNQNFYHIGTLPNENNEIFVYDLRMVVGGNENGFVPISINGRRARHPIIKNLSENDENLNSWEILGTNLSVKVNKNTWDNESERVIVMSDDDFNQLGIGLDDLIDGYIQTVLAVISIDKFCESFLNEKNELNYQAFKYLNSDEKFVMEL